MKNSIAVGIKDLQIRCIIGCLSEERNSPQTILVDVTMHFLQPAADTLSDTVDYVAVSKLIEEVATKGAFLLIETLAHEIAFRIAAKFLQVYRLFVVIKKAGALKNAAYTFTELEYER
jgi:FolB domain-containing protein